MKSRWIISIFVILIYLCGCTQYNGHLGPIFGSWSLVEVTEEGVPLNLDEETVFSFQNQIVQVVKRVEPPMTSIYRYGNFEMEDNRLVLKFQSISSSVSNKAYMTPDWIYLPLDDPSLLFDIKELNGKEMVLVLMSGTKRLQYTFTRTW